MDKVKSFLEKLHKLWVSDFSDDYQDYHTAMFSLMVEYGVEWKEPQDLSEENYQKWSEAYKLEVEDMFSSDVNTKAHDRYEVFEKTCLEYMEFTKMYALQNHKRRVA